MDHHWPLLGSARSVVRPLMENSQVTKKNHMLFMDCFYNCRALPPAEERTGRPGRGHRHAKPQAIPEGTQQESD